MSIPHPQRLVIVSNRLPFTANVVEEQVQFNESAGGLATGITAFLDSYKYHFPKSEEHLWVGWPGATIAEKYHDLVRTRALSDYRAYPVFLSEADMENFYLGFCNKTLWPLFHYFSSYTVYNEEYWQQYKRVNQIFVETLQQIIREDDLVWIQDYHLLLLPQMLKERFSQTRIGFFLHIPFPSFEMFRLLPLRWRKEILEGMLGADLIGFHTYEYTQHFLQSALRVLGLDHYMGQITLPSRVVKVGTYPMGIDFKKFQEASAHQETELEKAELRKVLGDSKVILSVDRLDYSKGILNRLQGYELLLELHPEFSGKVVLIMVVVPSRIGVDQYEQMKRQIEEYVGKINGRFGSISWTPILYQFRNLSLYPLAALYSLSDVALVTPLRDGMNLIAKEYVASRTDKTGVLLLSEMAGAAKELGEAIILNPNDRMEIATGLKEALEMQAGEQSQRIQIMQNRLKRYDVLRWAQDFVSDLTAMQDIQERFSAKLLGREIQQQLIAAYGRATDRLLLLDYDGTLTPLVRHPGLASPSGSILKLLESLSSDKRNTAVLISGRDRQTLENWFGHLHIALVAEHGFRWKEAGGEWQMVTHVSADWKAQLLPILEQYADRLPGALVEEKESSIVWHYRAADPEQARLLVTELTDHLVNFTANIDVQVLQGSKVVEVRPAGVNKGLAALRWISNVKRDFMLAVGDDRTDEDLFAILPEDAYSIRVGVTSTRARFNLRNVDELVRLLQSLVWSSLP
jgi:trehalose 6-phosphate synthase/phosphatase